VSTTSTTSVTITTAATTTQPRPVIPQLGPDGFGALKLGMSYAQAVATGMVGAGPKPDEGCAVVPVARNGRHVGRVFISGTAGVESLAPEIPVHTPEGATRGWTIDQLTAAYPELNPAMPHPGRPHVAVPGNPAAVYRMDYVRRPAGDDLPAAGEPVLLRVTAEGPIHQGCARSTYTT
jgi:hypothetical protein